MAIKKITSERQKRGWRFDGTLYYTYRIDYYLNGKRLRESGFPTKKNAETYLDALKMKYKYNKRGLTSPVSTNRTVVEIFETHLNKIENARAQKTALRIYQKFLSLLSVSTLNELRRKHFKDYCDTRIADGVKPETANREMTYISTALYKAGDYFAELEDWQVPKIYRPPVIDEGRNRVITADERTRLLGLLLDEKPPDESTKAFRARRRTGLTFYFALLTGLRHGEICALKKNDLRENTLTAERFKTKRTGIGRTVFEPLTETQIWVLTEAGKLYPESEYFFSRHGKPHYKIYSILKEVCKKLKIPYGAKTVGGLVFHDTRHTFITILDQAMIDSSTTRAFSGHTRDAMMRRYSHATMESKTKAMRVIEKAFGNAQNLETIG